MDSIRLIASDAYLFAHSVWVAESHPLLVVLYWDIIATLVTFAISYACDNSSIYDPYWSVIPPIIAAYYMYTTPLELDWRHWLMVSVVTVWGVRLTWNWWVRWGGLKHEDWRYVELRKLHGSKYWLVSLLGIHLFPTVMVWLGCVPLYFALYHPTPGPLNWLDCFGFLVAGGGVAIETVADLEMTMFLRNARKGQVNDELTWGASRHPNYLGEMMFWFGLAFMGAAAVPRSVFGFLGAIAITVMFLTVSIPWIEERQVRRRPLYREYQRRVPILIPWSLCDCV